MRTQGPYPLSVRTSYRKMSRSIEAGTFGFKLFQSLKKLTSTSAAQLLRCLWNFRALRSSLHPISRLRDFTRFGGKASYRLVNKGPGLLSLICIDPPFTLKRKCCYFDEIFVTGCTGSCHFDNLRCSQRWKCRQNDNIFVSVYVANTIASLSVDHLMCDHNLLSLSTQFSCSVCYTIYAYVNYNASRLCSPG